MNSPRSQSTRSALLVVLAVAVIVLAWVVVRVGTAGSDAAQPGVRPGTVSTATVSTATVSTATETTDPASGLTWIAESALPSQARDTLRLIRAGGPYPYPRNDDKTFRNNEGLLPRHPNGYYREYTVTTPGSSDRGARRIIAGAPDEKFWTDDHYNSFRRIREGV
ncbi:MAG: ribonuclease domain-containing protein [Terracoccus sp.]